MFTKSLEKALKRSRLSRLSLYSPIEIHIDPKTSFLSLLLLRPLEAAASSDQRVLFRSRCTSPRIPLKSLKIELN